MTRRLLGAAILAMVLAAPAMRGQNYTAQSTLAGDAVFLNRVKVALAAVAIDVINESRTTANHEIRAQVASQVIVTLDEWTRQVVWAVVANNAITAKSTDAAIKTRIAAVWNNYIGTRCVPVVR